MDAINIPALVKEGRIISADQVDLTEDYIVIGKYQKGVPTRRDGTQYPLYVIPVGELVKAVPYKIYSGLVSQTGTANPIVTIFENTLGFVPTWTRISTGIYRISFTTNGKFPRNKRQLFFGISKDAEGPNGYVTESDNSVLSDNYIELAFNNTSLTPEDNAIDRAFEIKIYN